MIISKDYLYKLKEANRIEDVIGEHSPLLHTENVLKCDCPLHKDKTLSCIIYPSNQTFFCFNCGVGGDVITFITESQHLDYTEAVKYLAKRAGIEMPNEQEEASYIEQRKRLFSMNRSAAEFFCNNLLKDEAAYAREYLRQRGLTKRAISKYCIGFAGTSWTALRDHMRTLGYTDKELIEASLITRSSKSDSTYDFFVNRIMFPFIDLQGNIVGFGGRTLDANDKRKYLNSRETIVFKKSSFLFSMNFAQHSTAKTRQLLLCEGNMDVISLNRSGFENAVATCGTAITDEHARLMNQYCDEVVICYDMDSAGRKAADKAIQTLKKAGICSKLIKMEGVKDPDEFIIKNGKEKFTEILDSAEDATSYILRRCRDGLNAGSEADCVKYLKRACKVLASISDKAERDKYISKVSRDAGISEPVLAQIISNINI